jgi:hypothetical protein
MKSRYAISQLNLDRPLCATCVRRSGGETRIFSIGNWHSCGPHKSRNHENQSGSFVREDRWQRIRCLRSFVHRSFDGKEVVHQEIATRNFSMRSESFMMRTRVRRSRGFGVRQFGILDDKKLTTGGIAKSRNTTVP